MTKRNERTSARVARIASWIMAEPSFEDYWLTHAHDKTEVAAWEMVQSVAASALTQAEDKPKRAKRGKRFVAIDGTVTYKPRLPKPRRRARRK